MNEGGWGKTRKERLAAHVAFADGTVFSGFAIGATPAAGYVDGEVVFTTVMSGYQEVLTDPSYAGQIVTFTVPHIGNYGVNPEDAESDTVWPRGVVMRALTLRESNWRATGSFEEWMVENGLFGVAGVDTRALTRYLRSSGAMPGVIGVGDPSDLVARAELARGTDGQNLAEVVSTRQIYEVPFAPIEPAAPGVSVAADVSVAPIASVAADVSAVGENGAAQRRANLCLDGSKNRGDSVLHIVAVDYGVKSSMLRQLSRIGRVTVVPSSATSAEILTQAPDGVFLSNGPGDPSAVTGAVANIGELLGQVPVFGICLGFQLLSLALGARTEKLAFGHHGGNHPVRRCDTWGVEVTSQNHNYAVAAGSLPENWVTHVNLNDGVIEGLAVDDRMAFGVQYHPEAAPGPHDAGYLFGQFQAMMLKNRSGSIS